MVEIDRTNHRLLTGVPKNLPANPLHKPNKISSRISPIRLFHKLYLQK